MTHTPRATLPHLRVPRAPANWAHDADPATWIWGNIPALPPFIVAAGSGPALQQTTAHVCYDDAALYVRFDCQDRDIWGAYTQRDDPIYDEEVVEVFIAPGSAAPAHYYEFEVSPNGVLLDALIDNPTAQRADLRVDFEWDCPGLRWWAGRDDDAGQWWAALAIPWAGIGSARRPAAIWRANFYRIERPRDAEPEFSCWSPTYVEPIDFHKPACFGMLYLE
jgi:Carbohydrate-binding family 9